VAGSTHEGEESAVLEAFRKLTSELNSDPGNAGSPPARLVLVPRHPERFSRVADLITAMGFRPRRYSAGETFEQDSDVFLLDTIGQLFRYYSVATVAFVGGTLAPIGGHNILEPYAFGVPVVCGPSVEKTLDSANGLMDRQAIRIVQNGDQLAASLIELSRSEKLRRELGERGRAWLSESQGAVGRTLSVLESFVRRPDSDEHRESLKAQADGAKKT
jgi:3-deoxy-D-manno-octulosonic-acid transferase